MSKRILCYGDSNTWGYDPNQPEGASYTARIPYESRWTGIVQRNLGDGYRVIEEGHNGRTTVWDDPMVPYRNGLKYIDACMESHAPIDLIILMIGVNDMKPRISGRAFDSAKGLGCLVDRVKKNPCGRLGKIPKILIISPIAIGEYIEKAKFADEFGGRNAYEQSLELPRYLKELAEAEGCGFLDAAKYSVAVLDGIHMDEENHTKLAEAVTEKIKEML